MTPKENANNNNFQFATVLPPPTQKNANMERITFVKPPPSPLNGHKLSGKTSQMEIEDTLLKEANSLAGNMVNYLKFVHKIIKFITPA